MNLLEFPADIEYGSIFDLNKSNWWEIDKDGYRLVPSSPYFEFDLNEYSINGTNIKLVGMLSNYSEKSLEIPIFPSPHIFHAELESQEESVAYIGKPRYLNEPPSPHVLLVPANSQILFFTNIEISNYSITRGSTPFINWSFMTWDKDERKYGKVKLPEGIV